METTAASTIKTTQSFKIMFENFSYGNKTPLSFIAIRKVTD